MFSPGFLEKTFRAPAKFQTMATCAFMAAL
jgi:hypothetical protein